MLFDLDFANNTILSCGFYFFLNYWLVLFLIFAVIAPIFNRIAELIISIGIPSKEAKAAIEIHPAILEAKIKKCSI